MKRVFDLIFSFLGLIFLSPIIILAGFIIYLQDKHSPFYIAKRIGTNNKNFNMIKLRTMIVNAEKSKVDSTSTNDPRITKVGKFICQAEATTEMNAVLQQPYQFWETNGHS